MERKHGDLLVLSALCGDLPATSVENETVGAILLALASRSSRRGRQPALCPVDALGIWRDLVGSDRGPVFRPLNRHGAVSSSLPASPDKAVARIVKRAVAATGGNPALYAAHSLRAGLATAAALGGASERSIMLQTGHISLPVVRRYIRDGSLFQENAVAKTGLSGPRASFPFRWHAAS
jgi:integrase